MRIGLFTNSYHPIVSGVVSAVDSMLDGLVRSGHSVFVVAPRHPAFRAPEENVFRYPSVVVKRGVDFPLAVPFSSALTRKIRDLHPDIAHAQHPFLLGNLAARLAKAENIPLVFTFHTRYEEYAHYAGFGIPEKLLRAAVRKMVVSFIKKCDAVIVPSPSTLELVGDYGGKNKAHLIPNAIPLPIYRNGNPGPVLEKYGITGKKIMIYVGRLAPEKNLSFLLRCFKRIVSQIPECRLMLVGDGPSRRSLEEEAKQEEIFDETVFTGMIEPRRVPDFLAAASFFVMPSTSEVNPLSLLESMAAGKPVLAVSAPGAADTLTNGVDGVLTREDESEFTEAALSLLKREEDLRRLSANAAKKGEEFGNQPMAKKLEDLYLNLSRAKGKSPGRLPAPASRL